MHPVDRLVLELAARQRGGFARWQLPEAPATDELIRRRLAAGWWIRCGRGVYQLAGLPPDADRALWIAWLAVGPDAVVSFECAAERHGIGPVHLGRLVFTTKHGDHHRIPGVTVHQLRDVLPHHVAVLDGLPTTTIPRTIVDLAAVSGIERTPGRSVPAPRTSPCPRLCRLRLSRRAADPRSRRPPLASAHRRPQTRSGPRRRGSPCRLAHHALHVGGAPWRPRRCGPCGPRGA